MGSNANWREAIARFDINLRKRMMRIRAHEVTGIDFNSSSFIRRALGFINRSRFPAWRDHTKEWRNRNRERVNIVARVQNKNWRLNNLKKARDRDRRYYLKWKARDQDGDGLHRGLQRLQKQKEGGGERERKQPLPTREPDRLREVSEHEVGG